MPALHSFAPAERRTRNSFWLALLILLAGTWLIYRAGLSGGFLFDDYANLPSLGETGPIENQAALARYLTSGNADPTGRPVSLLTFLIDAQDWPASPQPFKRTNLAIHLINGVLLALLLRRLGREYIPQARDIAIQLAAIFGAALWMLHPLFVSTTLYIVQREAMLPATFTLLGLLSWLQTRIAFQREALVRGWAWATLGFGLCTILATLSKANGILLPVLTWTLECFFLGRISSNKELFTATSYRHYRTALFSLVIVPSFAIAAYLFYEGWHGLVDGISAVRPWTLGQRLLTEPRVLMDYLRLLWLPHPFTTGLFNDQYEASTSLWSPASTWQAILAIAGLLIAAWAFRKKAPPISLAIAFFFAGQAMESTTVALELYFEHRNYLPAMLMFWPLALWLFGLTPTLSLTNSKNLGQSNNGAPLRAILALAILTGIMCMTYARTSLWGTTQDQALLWAKINPRSPRAQAYAAQAEMRAGHPEQAIARLAPALTRAPDQVQLALNLLAARCQHGDLSDADIERAATALRTTRDAGTLLSNWFGRALDNARSPDCGEMTAATIDTLLRAAMANPLLMSSEGRRQDLYHLQGRLALVRGLPDEGLASFNIALDQQIQVSVALKQAALFGASGYPAQGLAHLAHYEAEQAKEAKPGIGMPRIHAWVLDRQHYWDKELVRLRQTLQNDVARQRQAHHPA